jgi:beta-phosphoglucomutase-like phosphatase (HAD superfamily)
MSQDTVVSIRSALFFDFDSLVLGARKLYFDALAEILTAKGAALDPVLFSRFFVEGDGARLPDLYAKLGLDPADAAGILDQIRETVRPRLAASTARIPAGLQGWIDAVRARGAAAIGLTSLSAQEAEALCARTGLSPELVRLCPMTAPASHDAWTHAAATAGKNPVRCLAVVTDAAALHAAIAARFSAIAVPDAYTDFQDFCGADLVCADLADVNAADYLQNARF